MMFCTFLPIIQNINSETEGGDVIRFQVGVILKMLSSFSLYCIHHESAQMCMKAAPWLVRWAYRH